MTKEAPIQGGYPATPPLSVKCSGQYGHILFWSDM